MADEASDAAVRRPFVSEPPGSVDDVLRIARVAAGHWQLPEPRLLRLGMTGVCTAGDDVVLRVCRTTAAPHLALELGDLLVGAGVRVPAAVRRDVVEVDGRAVLAFERVHPSGRPVDWHTVGRFVATVHRLDPADLPIGLPLPRGLDFPWWQLDGLLADTVTDAPTVVDPSALEAMRRCLDRHRTTIAAARSAPRAGLVVCHGDVHAGNVVETTTGPVLLDWDLLCLEPPGWDHAALRTWASRWGGEPGAYEAFVDGAGEHLDDDPFTRAVAELRLVAATLMRVRAARSDPTAGPEAMARLRWWRGDPDAPTWRAV